MPNAKRKSFENDHAYNNRERLLRVKTILEENTDERHGMTLEKMTDILLDEQGEGTTLNRRSLYDDIAALNSVGDIKVSTPSGSDTTYRVKKRLFDTKELKLLIDSIQASKFLSDAENRRLMAKIKKLCSIHEGNRLGIESMLVANRVKSMNGSIFENLETIHDAIRENYQIKFKYFNYGLGKDLKPIRQYRFMGHSILLALGLLSIQMTTIIFWHTVIRITQCALIA